MSSVVFAGSVLTEDVGEFASGFGAFLSVLSSEQPTNKVIKKIRVIPVFIGPFLYLKLLL